MALQTINIGGYANDGTGDDLRTAFEKVNSNFAELGTVAGIIAGDNLGPATGNVGNVFAQRNATDPVLEFRTLTSTDDSVEITENPTTINLKNLSKIENDPAPKLGADLQLNGHNIITGPGNGDIQTTVWGLDVRQTNAVIELLFSSGNLTLEFGSIESQGNVGAPPPPSTNLDFNGLSLSGFPTAPGVPNLDFGSL